ncbi:MAG TPA: hypothetical protein VM536_23535 [Chloroflexia bacterium]|nr:hypothetical protein [Chloroflexia bacterium]
MRQQLAAWLRDLVATGSPRVEEARRRSLLAAGRDLPVVLARHLNTADPQAIRRLGSLAAAYGDRPAMIALLRHEALDPRNSDLKRMAIMVVLEQFLEQQLDDRFFSTLRDATGVALNSLVQVLESAEHDRNLLLAYLGALAEQHPAALTTVLDSVDHLSAGQEVEILRLLAQHQDTALADRACRMLAAGRNPTALLALRVLQLVTPPARREFLARALRKLAMAGVDLPDFPVRPQGARALLTGVDGAGGSALWFVVPRGEGQVELLSLLLSETRGITDAFGGDHFSWDDSEDEFLDIDFDTARQRVAEHQAISWATGTALPWEYRLLHDIIWRYGPIGEP